MSMVNVQNLGFGGTGIPDAMPKAIAELQGMRMTIVTGAAGGTLVPVPGMDPEDHIGAVLNMTDLVDVPLNTVTIGSRNASATITGLTTAVDGDKVTVNGKAYTFKDIEVHTSYNAPPGVVPIDIGPSGSIATQIAERLAKAIMSGDSTVTATVAGAVVTVKVRTPGTAGNAYTLTETGSAVTVSGAVFTGGAAAASQGFSTSGSQAAKKLLVIRYDKVPGGTTQPLLARRASEDDDDDERRESDEPSALGKMVFRGGKRQDEGRDDDVRDEDRKDDDRGDPKPPDPGRRQPKAGR